MKTTLQILEDALVLVLDGCAQGDWAHDDKGYSIHVDSPKATCFCPEGAIMRANGGCNYGVSFEEPMARLKEAIATELSIPDWNDVPERTKDQVVDAFKTAIAIEKRWLGLTA